MNDINHANNKNIFVLHLFQSIANTYDRTNFLISLGQHKSWNRWVVSKLNPQRNCLYLDIGCGTGDLSFAILKNQPDACIIAADFTAEMINVGRKRANEPNIQWVVADAQALPFAPEVFHGLVSGYLIRNVLDISRTLQEQKRVLRCGGTTISLDTTPPAKNLFYPFISAYLRFGIPLIGKFSGGNSHPYSYLKSSTMGFVSAKSLAEIFLSEGYKNVGFIKKMFGTIAIHFAKKARHKQLIPNFSRKFNNRDTRD